ncbi:hypothetical protein PVAP13_5KG406014 [Panicum virgatum]|uniref:Uncharacterized protein n=1 Tax=Panicum virgatum TaxID=38727 RepID=A0A8T0SJA4_PANVG|nr:hypothetical protein PVAP13_5KG406014 [Panicum virgatum]
MQLVCLPAEHLHAHAPAAELPSASSHQTRLPARQQSSRPRGRCHRPQSPWLPLARAREATEYRLPTLLLSPLKRPALQPRPRRHHAADAAARGLSMLRARRRSSLALRVGGPRRGGRAGGRRAGDGCRWTRRVWEHYSHLRCRHEEPKVRCIDVGPVERFR